MHETSSPYNPRSNGHAEAAVKAAKYLLLKVEPAEFPTVLAAWRNTARENKPSPNELMFCRKVRDGKAILTSQLNVKTSSQHIPQEDPVHPQEGCNLTDQIQLRDQIPLQNQDQARNRKLQCQQKEPEQFQQGDPVRVQDPISNRWNLKATVTGFSQTGRTLELLTEGGNFIQRNRRFVRLRCAALPKAYQA